MQIDPPAPITNGFTEVDENRVRRLEILKYILSHIQEPKSAQDKTRV